MTKITDYPVITSLDDTDLIDVSTDVGGTPASEAISWGDLKTLIRQPVFTTESGATDTIVAADLGTTKVYTNAGGCTITLPDSLGAFQMNCKNDSGGSLTFAVSGTAVLAQPDKILTEAGNGQDTVWVVTDDGINWYVQGSTTV